jgi:hypothetical protein
VRRFLALSDEGREADPQTLGKFAGSGLKCVCGAEKRIRCEECQGTGYEDIEVCPTCDGRGKLACPDCSTTKRIRVAGTCVDWLLLRKVLATLPSDVSTINAREIDVNGPALALFAADWRAVIMSMCDVDGPEFFACEETLDTTRAEA